MLKRLISTTTRGRSAETAVLNFLEQKGLSLLERNFRCKLGEIDLIMRDADEIVFVEVRSRNRTDFGYAEETVTRAKQRKIINSADYYLQLHPRLADRTCRFDVVSVTGETVGRQEIDWIQDAFQTTPWT